MQARVAYTNVVKASPAAVQAFVALHVAPRRHVQHNGSSSSTSTSSRGARLTGTVFGVAKKHENDQPESAEDITGIVFQPFEEVGAELSLLDQIMDTMTVPGPTTMSTQSLARYDYAEQLEAAVNEQINVEYTMSYIYHSLAAFMDCDNVGLPGFAAYFKHQSDEEREHANKLMIQQNRRGGKVKLQTILRPEADFTNSQRGEALWSLELALGLEKLNFGKLRELHTIAGEANDAEMCQFIEDNLLREQAEDIKLAADLVSRARRAGHGLGVFELDMYLQREYGYGLGAEPGGDTGGAA